MDIVLAAPEEFSHSEERRLLYVAMTRARHAVYLLGPKGTASSFLAESEGDLGAGSAGEASNDAAPCPNCKGGHLRVRRTAGERTFVGCSNYPYCDHTERACPKCGQGVFRKTHFGRHCDSTACGHEVESCPNCETGWLAERTRRDGAGSFVGCSNYPECRFTKNLPTATRNRQPRGHV